MAPGSLRLFSFHQGASVHSGRAPNVSLSPWGRFKVLGAREGGLELAPEGVPQAMATHSEATLPKDS